MRKYIYKALFILPAFYLTFFGWLEVISMMWFGKYWGYYIPLAIYIGCVGIFYTMLISGYTYEGMRNATYTITASIGIIFIAITHMKRFIDGSSNFILEYIGYIAFIAMMFYPYVVKHENA